MTKILIVDYSLEIVIAIINNDSFEQMYAVVWSCKPYFYTLVSSGDVAAASDDVWWRNRNQVVSHFIGGCFHP